MEIYFEHLINATYRAYQDILIKKHGDIYPLRSAIIKFGGFQFSHNWYGKTNLIYDKVGNLKIYTKTIYLNSLFINKQFGITNNSEYDLPNLANLLPMKLLIACWLIITLL